MATLKTVKLGAVEIGRVARVVGTLSSLSALEGFSAAPQRSCDLVEVRLDLIGAGGDWLECCEKIEKAGFPVVLTLRSKAEGGRWDGAEWERVRLYKNALGAVSAIDLELNSGCSPEIVSAAERAGKATIVSYHNFNETPTCDVLSAMAHEAAKIGSIAKISTMVTGAEDVATLRRVLTEPRTYPLCVIGMGSKGAETRTSFPTLGSCLTYGYLDEPAAPAQLSADELMRHLRGAAR